MMKRILLVDDHDLARGVLKHFLEMQGYRIEEAENGLEGLAKLDEGQAFDLVISDIQMPGMTGIELLEVLAQRSSIRTQPIILSTSLVTQEVKEQALRLGAYAVLSKPYNFRDLGETLARALAQT